MSKTFAVSLGILVGALSAAGLARAEGADGPSYPALVPVQALAARADVRAAAARAGEAAPGQWQSSADGGTFPALAPIRSLASRADVQAAARAAALDAGQGQSQASADGAIYPALQNALPNQPSRAGARMLARGRVGASDIGISEERYRN